MYSGHIAFNNNYVLVDIRINWQSLGVLDCSLECPAFDFATQDSVEAVDLQDLLHFYERLDLLLLQMDEGAMSVESIEEERELQNTLGKSLIRLALPGELFTAFEEDVKPFARKRRIVLVFHTNDSKLESIPWELLGNPHLNPLLNLNASLAICRGISVESSTKTPKNSNDPMVVMLVSSAPLDRYSPNPDEEFNRISSQFKDRATHIPVTLKRFANINYHDFTKKIQQIQPVALHIALHGNNGCLSFQFGERHQRVPFDTLVEDIHRIDSLQLVILNVCHSARSEPGSFNLARRLAERSVPAVIAMAGFIPPRASVIFSERLYAELSLGCSIIEAFERAVDTFRIYPEFENILWSVPMLYQTANVIPFPTILRHKKAMEDLPELPRESLEEILDAFEEFRMAFEDIDPVRSWTTDDWKSETMPISFLIYPLEDRIRSLKHLPRTYHLPSMPWLFELQDAQVDLERSFNRFHESFDELLSVRAARPKPDQISRLLRDGRKLIEQFEITHDVLEGF